jgi:acyl-CoA thioester hydrolase
LSFELTIAVEPSDIDLMGHVNNVTYLRWVQEAAAAHWSVLAPSEDQAKLLWIVLRHEIDYKQAALLGDRIIARTWVGGATRLRFERFTEILRERDRAVLAAAKTIWCPVDSKTLKPVAVSPAVRALFSSASTPPPSTDPSPPPVDPPAPTASPPSPQPGNTPCSASSSPR